MSHLAKNLNNGYYLILKLYLFSNGFKNNILDEGSMKFKLISVACIIASLSLTHAFAATPPKAEPEKLLWSIQESWDISEKALDMVHSLDGKYVFILTDKNTVTIYSAQGQHLGTIPVDEGVNAIDIEPRGERLYLLDNAKNSFTSISIDFIKDINIVGSPFKGKADAPITIVDFTDFECPYCSKIVPILEEVLKNNPDKVKLVFKNMPLRNHQFAVEAASAALAAGEQGKFWEFHDKLFASPKLNSKTIDDIAVTLNLDLEKYKKDKSSNAIRQKIATDIRDANEAGVTGTPTVFINGRLLKDRTPEAIQDIIDNELGNTKK